MKSVLSVAVLHHVVTPPKQLAAVIVTLALLGVVDSASAFQAEYNAYQQAISRVCTTKITPEIMQLYQAAVAAIEKAKSSGRAPVNLAGSRPPEMAYLDCFQGR